MCPTSSAQSSPLEGSYLEPPHVKMDLSQFIRTIVGVSNIHNDRYFNFEDTFQIHRVDGILKNDWQAQILRDVRVHSELKERLAYILNLPNLTSHWKSLKTLE